MSLYEPLSVYVRRTGTTESPYWWIADRIEELEAERDRLRSAIESALRCDYALTEHDPEWRAARDGMVRVLREALYLEQTPVYCAIHQHYKWCEHNGGVLGSTGYESPDLEHTEDGGEHV